MFGKKQSSGIDKEAALKLISEAFADMEDVKDGAFLNAYIGGLVDMAFTLGAIDTDARINYKQRAHDKEQELKAKAEPVYKKKGVYEYKDYYILKSANNGDGAANWSVQRKEDQKIIKESLTFKEAVKVIDDSNN